MKRGKGKRIIKRGVYILPSIFTSLSLFCGFYSLTASLKGSTLHAAWAIIIAAVFDAADGRIARLTHSVSRFGEYYDSLADMISFGIAPAFLLYTWALIPFGRWGWLAAFLYVICAALRLARFNLQSSSIENRYFQGLPSPPAAVMVAITVIFLHSLDVASYIKIAMPLVACLLALLMVSTLRYHSFKDFDFRKRRSFNVLVALVLLLIILLGEPEILLFTGTLIYTLSGPARYLLTARKKRVKANVIEQPRFS